MKKLLILILALVMCLSVLTSCDQIKGIIDGIIGGEQPDEIEYHVDRARSYLNNMYKNENATTAKDYEVVGNVKVAGVDYAVTWATDTDKVTITGPVTKEDGSIVYVVNVDEESATELPYVLTATITAGNGETATVSFNRVVPEKNLFVSVGNPEEGVAYKFFMIQVSEGNKILYADGTTQSNQDKYLNTTQVGTDAPDFFVEKVGEGFKFYYVKDGTNMYIKAYLTTTDHVKYSKCLMYTSNATEGTVWTYHADTNSWHTDLVQDTLEGDKTVSYVIGSYGTYLTFSISESSYIKPENTGVSQFPGGLLPKAVAEVDNSTPEEKIQATIDAIKLPELVSANGVVALPTAGERYPDVTISWASNADYAVVGENGLTVTLQDTEATVTLTATLTFGEVTKTQEFTLNLASSLVMNEKHAYGTYIYQGKLNGGTVLYLDGGVSGRYLTTTTDATKGVSVYAEKATGGYKLYILDGETKMYINIYNNADGKTSVNYAAESETVYTYNKSVNAWTTVFGENEVYLGTYNEFNTISVSNLSYITAENTGVSQFPLEILPVTPNGAVNMFVVQAKLEGKVLYLDGGVSGRYLTTTENPTAAVAVYAEKVEGGFKFYILDGETKMYINIYNNADGKTSVNYAAESETVYTYNKSVNAWTTVFGENEVYLGTYNTFNTISVSNLSYITAENTGVSQFPLDLHAATIEHVCSFEDVVVEATCKAAGSVTPTCACGEIDAENVKVLPAHTLDENYVCTKCGVHVLDASVLEVFPQDKDNPKYPNGTALTHGIFDIYFGKGGSLNDGQAKDFADALAGVGTHRINFGGSSPVLTAGKECATIKFTTTGAAKVTIWWVAGDTDRHLTVVAADGTVVYTHEGELTKNNPYICTVELAAAGEYFISSVAKSNYIFRVEVAPVQEVVAGEQTASKTMAELIASEGWTSSTTKQEFNLDANVTVKVDGGNNTGKAYNGDHIRIYATDTPAGTLTISVAEGYELVSIKVTTVTGTYAFLYVGEGTTDICNTVVEVSGSSVVLNSVKNGSDGKQVRVLAIEVVYQAAN